jgi:hypothetical protein
MPIMPITLRVHRAGFTRSAGILLASLASLAAGCQGSGGGETGAGTGTATDTSTGSTGGTGTTAMASSTDDTPTTSLPTSTSTSTATDGTGDTGSSGATGSSSTSQADTTQGVETVGTTQASEGSTAAETGTGETMMSTGGESSGGDSSTGEPPPPSDIEVVITADNAYSFAYGTDSDISKFFGGIENKTAGQIFNCGEGPELYTVPAADAAAASFLYIIAWDDSAVSNGVLARFRRKDGGGGFGEDVFTGTKGWQACATGLKYQIGSGGPDLATINTYIDKCNEGKLDPNTTSGGWVDEVGTPIGAVAFGEDNTTPYDGGPKAGNEFPLVCPKDMPAEARWMWFNWDPAKVVPPQSAFLFPGGQNPYHQFLLFRFAAELVPEPQ